MTGSNRLATIDTAGMAADERSQPERGAAARSGRFDTLRHRLVLFLIIALAPVVLANVAQGLLTIERERTAARDRLIAVALGATGVQENIFAGADQVLRTLAALPAVRDVGANCDPTLSSAMLALPYAVNIARVDADGIIRCAALSDADGVSVADIPWWHRLAVDGRLTISGVRFGRVTQRDVVVVARPVAGENGAPAGAVTLSVDVDWLDRALEQRGIPEDALIALIATDGSVIAGGDQAAARTLMSAVVPHLAPSPEPSLTEAEGPDGREWSFVMAPILDERAYVAIAMPSDSLFRWSYFSVAGSLLLPAFMVALALVTIWFATERLAVRWLRYLQRVTAAYAAGHYALRLNRIATAPAEFRDLGRSVTTMADAVRERDRRLRETVVQRTALVREIHHRIKNSLQIVTSLISLQAVQIKDAAARASFEVLRSRVDALALAHRLIREAEDGSRIELQDLISELAAQHANGVGRETQRLETTAVECLLPTDQAVPLALLLNELLTTLPSPPGERQRITIALDRIEPGMLSLTVSSDRATALRPGPPGSALIEGFVAQLHGRIAELRDDAGGTAIRVTFADPGV